MTDLVAVLSTGKGTWGHVGRRIADGEWDSIYLITNDFGREKFTAEKESTFIVVDSRQPMNDLISDIKKELKDRISGEVALNITSGSGKEHMALLSVLMQCGVGFRFVALTKEGIKEV